MQKLQNSFNEFLPLNYREFRQLVPDLSSKKATVAELLRICCEENDVKAMKMAFERILGKPEKVVIIKRTVMRMVFPEATSKHELPVTTTQAQDATEVIPVLENKVVVDEANAPGVLLRKQLDDIGEQGQQHAYDVIENRHKHSVAEVFASNVYAVAMRGGNLGAIDLLFNYLDGAVADVIRLEGTDTLLLENYADVAPYEAKQDDKGTYYIEVEAVK